MSERCDLLDEHGDHCCREDADECEYCKRPLCHHHLGRHLKQRTSCGRLARMDDKIDWRLERFKEGE